MNDKESERNVERSIGRLEGKLDALIAAVNTLSASFESLEKGRLSNLEIAFSRLNTEVKEHSRYTAMWTSVIFSVFVTVITTLIIHFFKL